MKPVVKQRFIDLGTVAAIAAILIAIWISATS